MLIVFLRWLNVGLVLITFLAFWASVIPPAQFWPLIFTGLSFPFLLVAHLFFLTFWLLRKQWYLLLLSAGTLIIGFPHIQRLIGLTPERPAPASGTTLTVVTYNIYRTYQHRSYPEQISAGAFAREIATFAPDILCLQEFPAPGKVQKKLAKALAQEAGLPYRASEASKSMAIFSRYPLTDSGHQYFTHNSNGFQWARIDLSGREIMIYNMHLKSNRITGLAEKVTEPGSLKGRETWTNLRSMLAGYRNTALERVQQAHKMREHMAQPAVPYLICGDLNDVPQSHTYRILSRGMTDTFQSAGWGLGFTYAGGLPALRIDYILANPQWRVLSCRRGPVTFSDHRPVVSKLWLSPKSE